MSDVTIDDIWMLRNNYFYLVEPGLFPATKDLFWAFMFYHYGKVGGVVLALLLKEGDGGLDIYELATDPLLKDGSPTLEANVLRLRVAICALKKKMRDDPYTRDYEIKNSQKNNMETGRYVLTKKTA